MLLQHSTSLPVTVAVLSFFPGPEHLRSLAVTVPALKVKGLRHKR